MSKEYHEIDVTLRMRFSDRTQGVPATVDYKFDYESKCAVTTAEKAIALLLKDACDKACEECLTLFTQADPKLLKKFVAKVESISEGGKE